VARSTRVHGGWWRPGETGSALLWLHRCCINRWRRCQVSCSFPRPNNRSPFISAWCVHFPHTILLTTATRTCSALLLSLCMRFFVILNRTGLLTRHPTCHLICDRPTPPCLHARGRLRGARPYHSHGVSLFTQTTQTIRACRAPTVLPGVRQPLPETRRALLMMPASRARPNKTLFTHLVALTGAPFHTSVRCACRCPVRSTMHPGLLHIMYPHP
jgi:hypothetical protein